MSPKARAKKHSLAQTALGSFSFDVSSSAGSLPLLPQTREANSDRTNSSEGIGIGVADDGAIFETLEDTPKHTSKETSKKRSAPTPTSPKGSPQKLRITGGRPAIAKRVTADLDSDDEIIVSMKRSGSNPRQIADRLRAEGRINYKDKTITSRYARIMKAQEVVMEIKAATEPIEWREDDVRPSPPIEIYSKTNFDINAQLKALTQAVTAVDKKILIETERLKKYKWQMVVNYLRNLRPAGTFSQVECERRFKQLVERNNLDSKSGRLLSSVPQPGSSRSGFGSGLSSSLSSLLSSPLSSPLSSLLSFPLETDDSGGGSSSGENSGDGDDELEDMDTRAGVTVAKRKAAPVAAKRAVRGVAVEAPITNRSRRATVQENQRNVVTWNAAVCLRPCQLGALPTSANGINGAGTPADSPTYSAPYAISTPPTATASVVDIAPAATISNVANWSGYARQSDYVVNKVRVHGREVPEPAATGRRLLVQNLPRWVTPMELQMVFKDFNISGSIYNEGSNESWFVDVATANDATRAVASLNRQMVMGEIVTVVVYRHLDMLGFNFGKWPRV
ncbi:MAG: hypothetical protein M1839_003715 [Geoglossum umbratile]|nr:MAG: hypothetical protein M1839_003715 [Geoglossum umbratile]